MLARPLVVVPLATCTLTWDLGTVAEVVAVLAVVDVLGLVEVLGDTECTGEFARNATNAAPTNSTKIIIITVSEG